MAVDVAASQRKLRLMTTTDTIADVDTSPDSDDTSEEEREESISSDEDADNDDDADEEADADEDAEADAEATSRAPLSPTRLATIFGLVAVVALAAVAGWLGVKSYHSYQTQAERELYVQVARQGAINLTTIDWQRADADVQRILDSATGSFYDDFSSRSQPFVDVVKQAQSTSVGTVVEAGVESATDNGAQVLVAVSVMTSNPGAPEQQPRAWRMRITVDRVGDDAKVSNVEFVP